LCNETNAFAPFPTDLAAFAESHLCAPGDRPSGFYEAEAVLDAAEALPQASVFQGTCAYATPSGIVTRAAYETLRDRILKEIAANGPFDIVALYLHGAMIADGYPDPEGDLLGRLRAQLGSGVTVGAMIDPHASLSIEMVSAADILVAFKEYPHTDFRERAGELMALLAATAEGRVRPRSILYDTGTLAIFHTTKPVVHAFVDKMQALERSGRALSISLIHGFPWSDCGATGTRLLVVADAGDAHADALAQQLAREAQALAAAGMDPAIGIDAALSMALSAPGPVVLADSADNPGGGAPADSTFIAQAIVALGSPPSCIGPLWDPMAVALAFRAGIGARLAMRIGGKSGPMSGKPLDLDVEVVGLAEAGRQTFAGAVISLGRTAAVRAGGLEIVLCSDRVQAFGPDLFTHLGVDPAAKKIVVVKSSRHFEAGFAPIASQIITVDAPGALQSDFRRNPYRHMQRPRAPLDRPPPPYRITAEEKVLS
jgi:microcystin degradation protein MlrC